MEWSAKCGTTELMIYSFFSTFAENPRLLQVVVFGSLEAPVFFIYIYIFNVCVFFVFCWQAFPPLADHTIALPCRCCEHRVSRVESAHGIVDGSSSSECD